jgi:hypothetical protein
MSYVASGVNRSDVQDLFSGRVRKPSPSQTNSAKHNQDDPKRLIHSDSCKRNERISV